jgi:hypothetical protein
LNVSTVAVGNEEFQMPRTLEVCDTEQGISAPQGPIAEFSAKVPTDDGPFDGRLQEKFLPLFFQEGQFLLGVFFLELDQT